MAALRRYTPAVLAVILLVLVMIFAGCGAPAVEEEEEEVVTEPEEEEPEEPEEEEEEEPEEVPAITVTDWENPLDVIALINRFTVLEWTWTPFEDGQELESMDISYRYEGSEAVGDVDTSKVSILFHEEELVIWADAGGKVVQAQSGGEMLPDMVVGMVIDPVLTALFAPFQMFETLQIHDVLTGTGPGWAWKIDSVGGEQIGDLQVEVTTIELAMGPSVLDPGEEVTITFGVGDFGDFQMLVGWEGESAAEQAAFKMQVTNVVLR